MESDLVCAHGASMAITHVGEQADRPLQLVWGHGWGQSSAVFMPLAESLQRFAASSLIDFPGFGNSPLPPDSWGTADYADAVAEWLTTTSMPAAPRIWIGHSFGGRIGIQLASRHPGLLHGMVLIASAGLPRRRSVPEQLKVALRRRAFKIAKLFVPEGPRRNRLRARFGSADYQSAGAMRPIFTRVVNEDLTPVAKTVTCPTLLLYGSLDLETPPEIGERLQHLIPGAELIVLEGFDHYTVLGEGRHQVLRHILKFAGGIS